MSREARLYAHQRALFERGRLCSRESCKKCKRVDWYHYARFANAFKEDGANENRTSKLKYKLD